MSNSMRSPSIFHSLKSPPNPNKFDAAAARGKQVFANEGCSLCHTAPLYTNNKLTPAVGFIVPEDARVKYDISPISVGTDPSLTLNTRRGTGYYKVPSLKGVWYRSMFGHSGWCATLEDWFDPKRLNDDYIPTGFRPYGTKTYAVKGHNFGLDPYPAGKERPHSVSENTLTTLLQTAKLSSCRGARSNEENQTVEIDTD